MIRLVQLNHPKRGRRVAVVQGEKLRLLRATNSIYALAAQAIARGKSLARLAACNCFRSGVGI